MDSLLPYALIDTVLFIVAGLLVVQRGAFWHPLTMYLLFHGYTVTWRAWQLVAGAPVMYASQPQFDSIAPEELSRAVTFADLALAAFLCGAWWAYKVSERRAAEPIERRPVNRTVVTLVSLVCLPVGFYVYFTIRGGAFVDNTFTQTNYFQVMAMWPMGCLAMLIFTHGFRLILLIPTGVYLAMVATQGYHRHMLLLPLLFFTAYLLQSKRLRWPSWPLLIAGFCLLLVFPRLKMIGQALQYGDQQEALRQVTEAFVTRESYEEAVSNEQFLDQYAGSLTMVDDVGKTYAGSTYLAVLTLPVPRGMWPGKPGLADHIQEVSTTRRQYNVEGRIITYIGEAYFNFRHAGVVLIPLLLSYFLTLWCMRATGGPMARFDRYLYCVFFMAFLQLYRDGLLSLVVFTVAHNLPMAFAWALHLIPGVAPKVLDRPPADPLALEDAAEA